MKEAGALETRYRRTHRDDNHYLVDIRGVSGRTEEVQVRLYPCQNCLKKVNYRGFRSATKPGEKGKIVREFDAKEAFSLLWKIFDHFRRRTEALLPEYPRGGYTRDFSKISRAFRKSKGFICEQCGVNLKSHPQCTDTHHKRRDKRDNNPGYLECLCKLCHAKQEYHAHYKASFRCRKIITEERIRQGISTQ